MSHHRVLRPHQPRARVRGEAPRPAGAKGHATALPDASGERRDHPHAIRPRRVHGRRRHPARRRSRTACARRYTGEMLEQRDRRANSAATCSRRVLAVTHRRVDDDGVELSRDERRDDYSRAAGGRERRGALGRAPRTSCTTRARIARRPAPHHRPGTIWRRFTGGKDGTVQWYRRVYDRLREVGLRAARS